MFCLDELSLSREYSRLQKAIDSCKNLALLAPTGSGKSLGLPWIIKKYDLVAGQIIIVQPRRIAAVSLAKVFSSSSSLHLGDQVGYHVRFDRKCTQSSKIVYVTDGIIFRMLLTDKSLSRVGMIIFDEFHERTLSMDGSLALAKNIQKTLRPDLKIVVTSATIDLEQVACYLTDCAKIEITGRRFPVKIDHRGLSQNQNLLSKVILETKKAVNEYPGHTLIFMEGAALISKVAREILKERWSNDFMVLKLFGEMSIEEQTRVFDHSEKRKIIISTNIAETSLTIPGVRIVIDSGVAKSFSFDQNRGINTLLPQKICKSSADQRSGRAGREAKGYCVRLWSENEHNNRAPFMTSEIRRLDLSEIVLSLLAQNITPEDLDWYENVNPNKWMDAKQELIDLSLFTSSGKISLLGERLASIPLHPRLAVALNESFRNGFLSEVALLISMTESRCPVGRKFLIAQKDRNHQINSDLGILLSAYHEVKANNFSYQYCRENDIHHRRMLECERAAIQLCSFFSHEFDPNKKLNDGILKILIFLYPNNIACLKSEARGLYVNTLGNHVFISPNSVVGEAKWAIPLQVTEKIRRGKVQLEMEHVSKISEESIREVLNLHFIEQKKSILDLNSRKVIVQEFDAYGYHRFNLRENFNPNKEETAQAYAKSIHDGNLSLKNWNQDITQFFERLIFAETNFPQYELSSINDEDMRLILESVCYDKANWKEIKKF